MKSIDYTNFLEKLNCISTNCNDTFIARSASFLGRKTNPTTIKAMTLQRRPITSEYTRALHKRNTPVIPPLPWFARILNSRIAHRASQSVSASAFSHSAVQVITKVASRTRARCTAMCIFTRVLGDGNAYVRRACRTSLAAAHRSEALWRSTISWLLISINGWLACRYAQPVPRWAELLLYGILSRPCGKVVHGLDAEKVYEQSQKKWHG